MSPLDQTRPEPNGIPNLIPGVGTKSSSSSCAVCACQQQQASQGSEGSSTKYGARHRPPFSGSGLHKAPFLLLSFHVILVWGSGFRLGLLAAGLLRILGFPTTIPWAHGAESSARSTVGASQKFWGDSLRRQEGSGVKRLGAWCSVGLRRQVSCEPPAQERSRLGLHKVLIPKSLLCLEPLRITRSMRDSQWMQFCRDWIGFTADVFRVTPTYPILIAALDLQS